MLLLKLKSKYSSELLKVFAINVNKVHSQYQIELAMVTDTDKLADNGFDPKLESLNLTVGEFVDHVVSIENIG